MVDYESLLQETGFLPFFLKFDGYDLVVAQEFACNFDGRTSKIGSLQFQEIDNSISQATQLRIMGDKWFNKGEVEKGVWRHFLLEEDYVVD